MAQDASPPNSRASEDDMAQAMAEHGITCVPIDNFYYREFHYTNLRDAIAQAKRDNMRLGLNPDA